MNGLIEKAYAQTVTKWSPIGGDLSFWIQTIYGWITAIAGIIFVVMLLVGGVQYLTSAGNEEAASKAKKLIVDAVIGIIIVVIAWAAGTWVISSLDIDTGGIIPSGGGGGSPFPTPTTPIQSVPQFPPYQVPPAA